MNSEDSESNRKLNETLAALRADAEKIRADAEQIGVRLEHGSEDSNEVSQQKIDELTQRVDGLEVFLREKVDGLDLLVEKINQREALAENLSEFIRDLKEELQDIKSMRRYAVWASFFVSTSLFLFVFFLVFWSPVWFLSIGGSLQVPLLLSFTGGSILILAIVLKGLFRSRADRNLDNYLPESLKPLVEAFISNK